MTFFSQFLRSMYYHQKPNSTSINLICAMPFFFIHAPTEVFNWNFFPSSVCSHLHDISEQNDFLPKAAERASDIRGLNSRVRC